MSWNSRVWTCSLILNIRAQQGALCTYQHDAMRGGWTRRKAGKSSVSSSLTVAAVAAAATVAAAAAAAASAGASTRMSIVAQQEQQHHAPSFIAPSCTLPSSGRAPNLRAPNSGHRLSTSAFGRRPRPIDGDGVSLPSWDRRRGGSGAAGVLDRRHPRHLALNSVRKEGEEGATAAAAAAAAAAVESS